MSDLPGHDHDPDPAALDELRRAFGTDVPPPAPEPVDDATAVADEPDEPDEPDVDPSFRPTVPNPVVEALHGNTFDTVLGELTFEDCFVHDDEVVGEVGEGFKIAMSSLTSG